MKALVLEQVGKPLVLEHRPEPEPGPRQVAVSLRAAALNRRDFWITKGLYPGIRTPIVLGSDGAGVVASVADGVSAPAVGDGVIMDAALDWGSTQAVQADGFRILGMPDDGTFATRVVVPASNVHPKPDHLSWHEAAALPLAGLTAYRGLFSRGKLERGERVLVTGAGGGVATLATQFAVAAGAEVLVTSSSQDKIRRATELGAVAGACYREKEWARDLGSKHGPVALIFDGAGGEGFGDLVDLVAPGGRIVCYGATAGPPPRLNLFKVFWKQLDILGSTMGSSADFAAMLEFVTEHRIRPVVAEVIELADGNRAIQKIESSSQFGKIVLDIA